MVTAVIDLGWVDAYYASSTIYEIGVAVSNGETLKLQVRPNMGNCFKSEPAETRLPFLGIESVDYLRSATLSIDDGIQKCLDFVEMNGVDVVYTYGDKDIDLICRLARLPWGKKRIYDVVLYRREGQSVCLKNICLEFMLTMNRYGALVSLENLAKGLGVEYKHQYSVVDDAVTTLQVYEKANGVSEEEILELVNAKIKATLKEVYGVDTEVLTKNNVPATFADKCTYYKQIAGVLKALNMLAK